ncbi:MAG: GNAT family N-acetyltransferase [Clostridiales bacterium]|nr:GNAT family N-acetyltransferase [Clostridiales bacterium]
MNIQTKRLTITDLTLDMAEDIWRNSQDDDNRRFVPDEVFDTLDEATETVAWLIDAAKTETGPFLFPVFLKDGINIGYVQLCAIEAGYEIGYHIAKPYTGQGYASEAVQAFLPVIMERYEIDKVYGIVLEENKASCRVLEKCGFELIFEGLSDYQEEKRLLKKYWFKRV